MELVIMAGGMGSRFGGLKQIEPIDENGNFIIDYSIYDAIRCGYDKIVIVIKKENLEIFEKTIAKRIRPYINVVFVFQENTIAPSRIKPLGTGHAVLACKNEVSEKFAVINADDFYGYEAIKKAKESLENLKENEFSLIAFEAKNTMSKFGNVKRGLIEVENNILKNITECEICYKNSSIIANKLQSNKNEFEISETHPVSMNLWGFHNSIFKYLEKEFIDFCSDSQNLIDKEFFLPEVIENTIKNSECKVIVNKTNSKWLGLTYSGDTDNVKLEIQKLTQNGTYPQNLWK